nr:dipeptide ABC transporter ATP-binding protein [Lacrimispora sp.]
MMKKNGKSILKVENLKIHYPVAKGLLEKPKYIRAVDGVDFEVREGEVFGIVGESGCGKSTLSRGICRLESITEGAIFLDGEDITFFNNRKMRSVRKKIQMVFQDPYSSLDPRMTVFDIIAEPLLEYKLVKNRQKLEERVMELLRKVGLDTYHAYRYPHEFSGGQRQRVGIARALAVEPRVVIADEPVSALDVSIQAQVLNLLNHLKRELNLTYIFIAHDLSVVEFISDRIGVMYLGDFVEIGSKAEIYRNPCHPYTQGLLSSVPVPDPDAARNRILMQGTIPSAMNPPKGCKFHTRCEKCMEICTTETPMVHQAEEDHYVACHLYK